MVPSDNIKAMADEDNESKDGRDRRERDSGDEEDEDVVIIKLISYCSSCCCLSHRLVRLQQGQEERRKVGQSCAFT